MPATSVLSSPETPVISRKDFLSKRRKRQTSTESSKLATVACEPPTNLTSQIHNDNSTNNNHNNHSVKQISITNFLFKNSANTTEEADDFDLLSKIAKPKKMRTELSTPSKTKQTSIHSLFSSPIKSSGKTKKTTNKLTQLCLDAGQSDLKYITCPRCGMVYCKGQVDDESLHQKVCHDFAKHHRQSSEPIKYKSCSKERLIERIGLHSRIISINPITDSKAQVKKADQVRAMVEKELGCAPLSEQQKQQQVTYLYVEDDQVIGCLIAQQIRAAHRIVVSEQEMTPSPDTRSEKEAQQMKLLDELRTAEEAMNSCDMTRTVPAVCGVSRIWCHRDHRRKRIAWKLLDAVRKSLVYSYHIPMEQIAFSQPTTEGKLFAMKYTRTKQFLVFAE